MHGSRASALVPNSVDYDADALRRRIASHPAFAQVLLGIPAWSGDLLRNASCSSPSMSFNHSFTFSPSYPPPMPELGDLSSLPLAPRCIPAAPRAKDTRSRTVVLCFDGTGDKFDADNSNVVHLFSCLKKSDPTQILYYQAGIGTWSGASRLSSGISAALDMAVGSGLGSHVREGYHFLMQNYQEGDKICIFGFSRGSYTARALSGMLHKVGLLPSWNVQQIPFAYQMYKNQKPDAWELSLDFKKTFCVDVNIHFLGCWDTVASVGLIPRRLPYDRSANTSVRHFRHALALDEHRAKFKVNHWIQDLNHPATLKQDSDITPERYALQQKREKQNPVKRTLSNLAIQIKKPNVGIKVVGKSSESGSEPVTPTQPSSPGTTKFFDDSIHINGVSHSPLPLSPAVEEPQEIAPLMPAHALADQMVKSNGTARMTSFPGLSTTRGRNMSNLSTKNGTVQGNHQSHKSGGNHEKGFETENWYDYQQRVMGTQLWETDALEVWFAGAHCDVGGGAVPNKTRHQLARIPLRWMIRQTFECNTGILYDTKALASLGLDVPSLYPTYLLRRVPATTSPPPSILDRAAQGTLPAAGHAWALQNVRDLTRDAGDISTTEEHEDYFDAMSPINDMLAISKPWWVLELWPVKRRSQDKDGIWVKYLGPNLGRHRAIRDEMPHLHYSVLVRQVEHGYELKNEVDVDARWQVVM